MIYFLLVLIVIETKQLFCGKLTLKQRRSDGTSLDSENASELSGVIGAFWAARGLFGVITAMM